MGFVIPDIYIPAPPPAVGTLALSQYHDFRWPNGRVPYENAMPSQNEKDVVEDAVKKWNKTASVQFVPRKSEGDYVRFVKHNRACDSDYGRRGGGQIVRCNSIRTGYIMHEMGHAVGLIHEHQRPDRNKYVKFPAGENLAGVSVQIDPTIGAPSGISGKGTTVGKFDFESIMCYTTSQDLLEQPDYKGKLRKTRTDILTDGDLAAIKKVAPKD